jgi:hypothetical protein
MIDAAVGKGLEQLEPGHAGQGVIEQQDVEGAGRQEGLGFLGIAATVDDRLRQVLAEGPGDDEGVLVVVLDQEDLQQRIGGISQFRHRWPRPRSP